MATEVEQVQPSFQVSIHQEEPNQEHLPLLNAQESNPTPCVDTAVFPIQMELAQIVVRETLLFHGLLCQETFLASRPNINKYPCLGRNVIAKSLG